MNLTGIWQGTYQYLGKNLSEERQNINTKFTIEIKSFDGHIFSGIVYDDLETGGTKGVGKIKGKLNGNKISFTKKMPISTLVFPDGKVVEENRPHSTIYYSGKIENNEFSGIWRFKFRIQFINGIRIILPSKGTWQMKTEK